jgi:hypothetical protein
MPDVQEVFRMATQKVGPDPGALERQYRDQRQRTFRRKAGAYALVAALLIAGAVIGIRALPSDDARPGAPGPTSTTLPIPSLPFSGALEPGMYVASAIDPNFDASYRISITVPSGYEAFQGWAILKVDRSQTGVGAQVVGNVYADPCHWSGTLLDPPVGARFDALVAALANEPGNARTPTDVTLDGYAGKRMELTVPPGINLADCDGGQYRSWLDTGGGERYREPGQHYLLWIVDVDGVPLVIEASFEAGTSAKVRAELIQMVASIRIDPR